MYLQHAPTPLPPPERQPFFSCYALLVQGRQVLSLQKVHSKMNQWGPEWQRLQRQEMRLVSDLMREKEWAQELETLAMVRVGLERKVRWWWRGGW